MSRVTPRERAATHALYLLDREGWPPYSGLRREIGKLLQEAYISGYRSAIRSNNAGRKRGKTDKGSNDTL